MLDLDAGKYAVFVWSAFALTAAVFGAMIWTAVNHAGRWRRRAEALVAQSRDTRDRAARTSDSGTR